MHTSPLAMPGVGNAGGMNVYLDRMARTLVTRDVDVTVFTRKTSPDQGGVVEVEPGYRVKGCHGCNVEDPPRLPSLHGRQQGAGEPR